MSEEVKKKKSRREVVEELTAKIGMTPEAIKERAAALKDETDLDKVRTVICNFYGDRCCSMSSDVELSCKKDECVQECLKSYCSKIFSRPQEKWTADWDKPIPRETKVSQELGLACDSCYLADSCPVYKVNAVCGVDWGEEKVVLTPESMLDFLIKLQYKRIARAEKIEQVDGGVPDQNLSAEIDRMSLLVEAKQELSTNRLSIRVEEKSSNGGGLLSKLFGDMSKGLPDKTTPTATIDIPFTEEHVTEKISAKLKPIENEHNDEEL